MMKRKVYLNDALERQLSVFFNLYQADHTPNRLFGTFLCNYKVYSGRLLQDFVLRNERWGAGFTL
jgi:hypothetical protein